ncbi:hypothetical protein DTO013E5_4462 [Penicillium roqueforti]|uniref:Probable altered inheritance of mitochondria protein 13, mitochondrial n=1 Tax=Penicillium roqueforti (strain FM164) TaxID=1365484 RepID=W6QCJ3_PENRF|nr:uncharacterized protein LCP9604111_4406 [Penicillium roqueforti]CDM27322.1 Probable altered inheritance of mitochondria protein 13, mitochondrial [Penicillium roqueforti FM164]KAF9249250.1 hypothetical protein LCP9604111_4406 [Penicillium roqueforti]KAI1834238.1 hypothetical protein CBS147337_5202 [Penicillium roqueforti]KAI2675028.1 hypothetical protein CBS147355_6842 [Penicillium roqueforti]KAI2688286.1 hypothetical protein LCP963914a_2688 [Penicillium roqueforti]
MGAGNSKPEASAGSQHVFSSNSPVQFSSNLVDALQSNSETDSTRAKVLELEIQNRVAQELQRLREREQQTLAEIEKRISESKDTTSLPVTAATAPLAPSTSGYPAGSLNLDAPRIPFAGRHHDPAPTVIAPQETAVATRPVKRDVSRNSVAAEIEQLRSKLDGRRKLVELDDGVAKARSDVTSCLQLNDRRPLNCWVEVDAFKREVARMEAAFVDRIVG